MQNSDRIELPKSAVTGIEYVLTPWDVLPETWAEVDSVALAVRLHFEDEVVEVRWQTENGSERLTVQTGMGSGFTVETATVDVSSRWPSFVGHVIERQLVGYQETNVGRELWTTRFEATDGASLVISLGDFMETGELTYTADNLIVTASMEVSRAFRTLCSETNAWIAD